MSQFALDCLDRMHVLVKKLEVHLGPDTAVSTHCCVPNSCLSNDRWGPELTQHCCIKSETYRIWQ